MALPRNAHSSGFVRMPAATAMPTDGLRSIFQRRQEVEREQAHGGPEKSTQAAAMPRINQPSPFSPSGSTPKLSTAMPRKSPRAEPTRSAT
jgi:hypothetical protein